MAEMLQEKPAAPLFAALDRQSAAIIERFDNIIQGVLPLNSRQQALLPKEIAAMSRQLTSERGTRRLGYMNERAKNTAYVHYFMWWNLVRMTRLFAAMPENAFALQDGDVCIDLGSGPLTLIIALWLARPELRNKKLSWYCVDLSAGIMADGEELYLSVAARTANGAAPWNIIRVKGELGTEIRHKAALVTCANMFNEALQSQNETLEFLAKKYAHALLAHSTQAEGAAILVIEPGIPQNARLLSQMRSVLLQGGFAPISPCPHSAKCPMNGAHGRKWCNFAFDAHGAPQALQALSKRARLNKTRAVLSFILMRKGNAGRLHEDSIALRIASDAIYLPDRRIGFYACAECGLVLAIKGRIPLHSGDMLVIKKPSISAAERDKKSGAIMIEL